VPWKLPLTKRLTTLDMTIPHQPNRHENELCTIKERREDETATDVQRRVKGSLAGQIGHATIQLNDQGEARTSQKLQLMLRDGSEEAVEA